MLFRVKQLMHIHDFRRSKLILVATLPEMHEIRVAAARKADICLTDAF